MGRQATGLDDLRITLSDGSSFTVNLAAAVTIADVMNAIRSASQLSAGKPPRVDVAINAHGDGLEIIDGTWQSTAARLAVSSMNGSTAAANLGLGSDNTYMAIPFDATTRLAQLNRGQGVTLARVNRAAGNPFDLRFTLRDGTIFNVDLETAATLGDVVDLIQAASGATPRVLVGIDADNRRLVFTDQSTGAGTFRVDAVGTSIAGLGLGLGTGAASTGATIAGLRIDGSGIVIGGALHGDSAARHIFLSTATTPTLTGSLAVQAGNVSAAGRVGYAGVSVTAGTISGNTTIALNLSDPGTVANDGRIQLTELLGATQSAATFATLVASPLVASTANLSLPVAASPSIPGIASDTLSGSWSNANLLAGIDGTPNLTYANGGPGDALQGLAGISSATLLTALQSAADFLTNLVSTSVLGTSLPIINKSIGSVVNLAGSFQASVTQPTGANAVQQLTIAALPAGGQYRLSLDGQSTIPL